MDVTGNLFIADTDNHRVRRVDAVTRIITTVAGTGVAGYTGDGIPANTSALNYPRDVAVATDGTIYIADNSNFRIRRVAPGLVTDLDLRRQWCLRL